MRMRILQIYKFMKNYEFLRISKLFFIRKNSWIPKIVIN